MHFAPFTQGKAVSHLVLCVLLFSPWHFCNECFAFGGIQAKNMGPRALPQPSTTTLLIHPSNTPSSALLAQRKQGIQKVEEEEVQRERKFRLTLGIGGNMPRRDLSEAFETGTLMELIVGYHLWSYLQIEGGMGYTTGFLKGEGIVGFDAGTGSIVELRGSYIALPIGLKLIKSFRDGSMNFSIGGGALYNRYTQSLNLIDVFGLASRSTESRSGFGYHANGSYEHFFSGQYGIGARVRYVTTRTSGENVGGVLTGEGEDFDPKEKGQTRDAWISISVALLYRF